MSPGVPMSALERSIVYRGFADAFRSPRGGSQILSDDLIPAPAENANTEFLEAFDQAVSKAACSLYASAHSNREQMSLYEELIRWYDHFGLQRKAKAELPDHITVLLEFMHFLSHREHICREASEDASSLVKAQSEFLRKHVLPLALAVEAGTKEASERYRVLSAEFLGFARQHHEELAAA